MENFKKKVNTAPPDKDIFFSQSIKAGKRIYYLDVKKNRKDEMFLAITESKKVVSGEGEDSQVNFEKHKIFLYREDFEKFMEGMEQAFRYIKQCEEASEEDQNLCTEDIKVAELSNEINIDIDF